MAGQVALAIERAELEEQAREAEVLRKADEFQRKLLNSISHNLRAQLAAIVSAELKLRLEPHDARTSRELR